MDDMEMRTTELNHEVVLLIGIYIKKIPVNEALDEYKWQFCHMWDGISDWDRPTTGTALMGGSILYDNYDDCVLAMNDYIKERIDDGT